MAFTPIFLQSVYFVAVACVVAQLFFPGMLLLGTTALSAIGLQPLLHKLLDENRRAIWETLLSPVQANARLAAQFAAIFLAALVSAAAGSLWFGVPTAATEPAISSFGELLVNNFAVLMSGFALSFLFSSGGLVLVLIWNALHWSESFVAVFTADAAGLGMLLGSLPHLVLEVTAYILAGIAGVFFSKGLVKYGLSSEKLRRVTVASICCLAAGIVLLVAGCALESFLAGWR